MHTCFFINAILDQRFEEDLEEDIVEFRLLWESDGLDGVKTELEREVMSEDPREGFLRLLDGGGNEIYSSDMSHWRSLDLTNYGSSTSAEY